MSAHPTLVHADGLVSGDGSEMRDAAVLVSAMGEVLDVGEAATLLPRHAGANLERVRGVVFPGLVNAHTHLELSALRGNVPGGKGFVSWLDGLVSTRAELGVEEAHAAIERAARELDETATAAVGDVSNGLGAVHALARAGIGGIVFHEVFGMREAPLRAAVDGLAKMLGDVVGRWPTSDLAYAVAPHTLYTTHASVVADLVREARDRRGVTTLHLAEHPAERRALASGDGPMVDWLAERTKLPKSTFSWPLEGPVAHADTLGALGPHVLAVHVADADEADAALLAARESPVVLCPRSNLHIEVRLPPLTLLRAAGVLIALGTDSLASNASLDVLAEARALHDRFPAVPAKELVAMATGNGARALGRSDLGRIARGAKGGVAAIDGELSADGPSAFMLRHVKARRRWVARRPLPS